jgi:hypothetical protein
MLTMPVCTTNTPRHFINRLVKKEIDMSECTIYDPNDSRMPERFRIKFDVQHCGYINTDGMPSACWVWNAGRHKFGYGQFKNGGVNCMAYKIAYIYIRGNIPDGLLVCHHCDNPPCVNPAHLFVGTYQSNMDDKTAKGRNNASKGDAHSCSILTEAKVVRMRELRQTTALTLEDLSDIFGVCPQTVHDIVTRKRWMHI